MKKLLLVIDKNTKLQENLETLLFVCKVIKFTNDGLVFRKKLKKY